MVLGQNAIKIWKRHHPWENLGCIRWVLTKRYCVVLGQNANKIMKMHYHWGNLDCTLGKNHEILRGIWSKKNYENALSLGKSWVYTLGENHEIVRGFGSETRLKLRSQADWEDGGGGIRDDEGRGGHQALRPLQQHPPHPQDRQGQAIKGLSRGNLQISHVLRRYFLWRSLMDSKSVETAIGTWTNLNSDFSIYFCKQPYFSANAMAKMRVMKKVIMRLKKIKLYICS